MTPRWVIWLWKNFGSRLQPSYDKIKDYQPSPELKALLDQGWESLLLTAKNGGVQALKEVLELIKKELRKKYP